MRGELRREEGGREEKELKEGEQIRGREDVEEEEEKRETGRKGREKEH